jgi:UDP-glucose 4-epimerase
VGRVVLVTGVGRYLGARAAAQLADEPEVQRVLAVDLAPPPYPLGAAEFLRADIRSPVIAKILAAHEVDTVVHMNVLATPTAVGGRAPQKEINVIGTMQLLGACQRAPAVTSLVVKSSTTVYGASPKDPAMFTEDMAAKSPPRSGYAKDSVEVEGYVRGFARRRPDVAVTTLRFANFVGPKVRTPFTEYFLLPVIPTVLGFDARLQFIHEDDGLEAIRVATVASRPGIYNIAGDGTMALSQAVRRAGAVAAPVPTVTAGPVGSLFRRAGLADFSPEQVRFLTYGRGVDTERARRELGLRPTYTTDEAFDAFIAARRPSAVPTRTALEDLERAVVTTMTRGRADVAR